MRAVANRQLELACSAAMSQRQPVRVPNELEALLKAAKSIGLLNLAQASTMRNNVATGKLSAGVVTADLQKKLAAAKVKWEQEKADARTWAKGRWARAIFDFQPTEEVGDARVPDLSFSKEDIIQLTLGEPMKWWRGTLASSPSREEGEFPKNYVELLEKKTATCDHQGESSGELSIWAGDTIVIVRRGEDRCYGFTERRAGEVKPFPARCLQPVPAPTPKLSPAKQPPAPPPSRAARDARRAARDAVGLPHIIVDVSDDDEYGAPPARASTESPPEQATKAVEFTRRNRLALLRAAADAGAGAPKRDEVSATEKPVGQGMQRFMEAGAAMVAKLRAEEQALLAEMAAMDKVAELDSPAPPPVPLWPPSEKKRCGSKCLGWSLLITLTLTFCAVDFGFHYMFFAVPENDGTIYRHAGIGESLGANETDLTGWPRVERNIKHAQSIWDLREPCGQNWTLLMELEDQSDDAPPRDYLGAMRRVATCDGDSLLVNVAQSLGAGVIFALLGLSCITPNPYSRCCRRCRCRTASEEDGDPRRGSSVCCVFTECVVVFLLGELLSINHQFVAAGRSRDPSTVDLWFVTLGLLIGLSIATCPIFSSLLAYCCSCFTTLRLRKALAAKERQCESQAGEIQRLTAQLAASKARAEVTAFMHPSGQQQQPQDREDGAGASRRQQQEKWDEDDDSRSPDPLAQSDDLSDAGSDEDLGFHIFRDEANTLSEVLRVRFDIDAPIGIELLDGGVLSEVEPHSLAEEVGVTLQHTITAINGSEISRSTDSQSIRQLLSSRPVYVSFAPLQQPTKQQELDSAPDPEPPKPKVYSEF